MKVLEEYFRRFFLRFFRSFVVNIIFQANLFFFLSFFVFKSSSAAIPDVPLSFLRP